MNTINPSAINTPVKTGWLGSFAKSQLLKRLELMPRGYLLIEDGENT